MVDWLSDGGHMKIRQNFWTEQSSEWTCASCKKVLGSELLDVETRYYLPLTSQIRPPGPGCTVQEWRKTLQTTVIKISLTPLAANSSESRSAKNRRKNEDDFHEQPTATINYIHALNSNAFHQDQFFEQSFSVLPAKTTHVIHSVNSRNLDQQPKIWFVNI